MFCGLAILALFSPSADAGGFYLPDADMRQNRSEVVLAASTATGGSALGLKGSHDFSDRWSAGFVGGTYDGGLGLGAHVASAGWRGDWGAVAPWLGVGTATIEGTLETPGGVLGTALDLGAGPTKLDASLPLVFVSPEESSVGVPLLFSTLGVSYEVQPDHSVRVGIETLLRWQAGYRYAPDSGWLLLADVGMDIWWGLDATSDASFLTVGAGRAF